MYVTVRLYRVFFEVEFNDGNFEVYDRVQFCVFLVLVSQTSNCKIIASRMVCYVNCLYVVVKKAIDGDFFNPKKF